MITPGARLDSHPKGLTGEASLIALEVGGAVNVATKLAGTVECIARAA